MALQNPHPEAAGSGVKGEVFVVVEKTMVGIQRSKIASVSV